MSALPKRFFTPDEYLDLEVKAPYKSQYVGGEIFAMAGAQPWHTEVTGNLVIALGTRFRGRPCKAYFADQRVQMKVGEMYTSRHCAASRSSTRRASLMVCSIRR